MAALQCFLHIEVKLAAKTILKRLLQIENIDDNVLDIITKQLTGPEYRDVHVGERLPNMTIHGGTSSNETNTELDHNVTARAALAFGFTFLICNLQEDKVDDGPNASSSGSGGSGVFDVQILYL